MTSSSAALESAVPGEADAVRRALRPDLAHATEAEQAVLGALFLDPAAFIAVRDVLSTTDFSVLAHQRVYAACCELAEDGEPIDPVLVSERLQARGELGREVPLAFPHELAAALGVAGNVAHYATLVVNMARVRRVQAAAREILRRSRDAGEDPAAFLRQAHAAVVAAAALDRAEAGAPGEGDQAAQHVPDLIPGGQLLDIEYPPVEYAVDPILPLRELTEWTGKHGIFKSTLALAAALSVATGRRFGGFPVRKGKAVFITAEDGERTIALRTRAWLASIPVGADRAAATKAVREGFFYLAREHVRGLALTLVENGEPAARHGTVARLTQLVRGSTLVFLETAARLAEGDENANRVQAAFAQVIEQIAIDSSAAVGVVRHVGKQAARDSSTDSYAGRGGGALSDAARSVVNFTRPDAKGDEPDPMAPVVMTHAKATLSRPAQKLLWVPVETPCGSVYLRVLSDDEELRANAQKLLAALPPEGITSSDIHKRPPAGLSRKAAKAALECLVETGRVVTSTEARSRNKAVTVYRAAEGQS